MLSPRTIKQAIGVQPILTLEQISNIQIWNDYYDGKALQNVRKDNPVPSLMIAKTICGEIARNVTDEMESEIQGNDWLNEQWQRVIENWLDTIEKTAALGEIILRPFVYNDKILVNATERTTYFPVRYSVDGIMEAVVFVEHQAVGEDNYILLTYCDWTNGTYIITNTAFKSSATSSLGNPVPLETVESWKDLEPTSTFYNTSRPWFVAYTAPNRESVFANALKQIEEADEQDARITWENKAGETMLFLPFGSFKDVGNKNALNVEESKRKFAKPEGKENLFIETESDDIKPYTHSPALRNEDLHFRLEKIKRQIEIICGLSFGVLSEPSQVERTATEVKHGRQRFFVTVNAYQKASQTALEQLAIVMSEIATAYGFDGTLDNGSPTFIWGDSVLVTQEEKEEAFNKNMVMLMSMQNTVVRSEEVRAYLIEFSDYFSKLSPEAINEAKVGLPTGGGDDGF